MSLLFLIYLHTYTLRHGRHDDASDDQPQHLEKPLHHCMSLNLLFSPSTEMQLYAISH